MPIARRLPKRGFTNIHRKDWEIVNVSALEIFGEGATVDPGALVGTRSHPREAGRVKLLGDGDAPKGIKTVKVHKAAPGPGARSKPPAEVWRSSFDRRRAEHRRIPELQKRILFTLGMLGVYRIGAKVATPGINPEVIRSSSTTDRGASSPSSTCSRAAPWSSSRSSRSASCPTSVPRSSCSS